MTDNAFARPVRTWSSALLEKGWCVIPELVAPATIAALDRDLEQDFAQNPFCSGGFYGADRKSVV